MKHKISAYGFLFNASKYEFDTEKTVSNFCAFFDEVICATVTSEDDTREILSNLEKKYSNFKVIDTNVKITGNNKFDGQLKTIAMNECKNELRCITDYDEFFPLSNREKWDKYCNLLLENKLIDGIMIPNIDLFGNELKIRSDNGIGQKFRLHKSSVHARGVPNFAVRSDGLFDTNKSDNTEPINEYGDLCVFQSIVPQMWFNPMFADQLVDFPYVLHYGMANFKRKAKIGKEFWKEKWESYSGHEENVVTNENQIDNRNTIYHNLPLQ